MAEVLAEMKVKVLSCVEWSVQMELMEMNGNACMCCVM